MFYNQSIEAVHLGATSRKQEEELLNPEWGWYRMYAFSPDSVGHADQRETDYVDLSEINSHQELQVRLMHHSRSTELTKVGYYMVVIDSAAHITDKRKRDHTILWNSLWWITVKCFLYTTRSNWAESDISIEQLIYEMVVTYVDWLIQAVTFSGSNLSSSMDNDPEIQSHNIYSFKIEFSNWSNKT